MGKYLDTYPTGRRKLVLHLLISSVDWNHMRNVELYEPVRESAHSVSVDRLPSQPLLANLFMQAEDDGMLASNMPLLGGVIA